MVIRVGGSSLKGGVDARLPWLVIGYQPDYLAARALHLIPFGVMLIWEVVTFCILTCHSGHYGYIERKSKSTRKSKFASALMSQEKDRSVSFSLGGRGFLCGIV